MSWSVIARKDTRDAVRDGTFQWNTLFLALVTGATGYLHSTTGGTAGLTTDLSVVMTAVVPFAAVLVAHESIAFERATGRIRTTLALPHTRRDVLIGYALGRVTVLVATVGIALVVAAATTLLFGGTIAIRPFLGFAVATVAVGAAFAVIAVALSAMTRSTTRSLIAGGTVVTASLGWPALLAAGWSTIVGGSMPPWLHVLGGWDPIRAYAKTAVLFAGTDLGSLGSDPSLIGPALLAAWPALFAVIGIIRFTAVDL
ncbi:MAG: ABC transporter permease subunit [Halobacteriaceae archaeon]